MASVQTYRNGRVRITDENRILIEIAPRKTESGNAAATITIGDQTCELYQRSLIALSESLHKIVTSSTENRKQNTEN